MTTVRPQSDNALSSFTKLSPSVYLKEPSSSASTANTSSTSNKNNPNIRTIVLAFWMNAPARALVKFVLEYARLAPSARIIFLLSSSDDFLLHGSRRAQRARVLPAVEAILASTTTSSSRPEEEEEEEEDRVRRRRSSSSSRKTPAAVSTFMHIFSNGGVAKIVHLLDVYRLQTGEALRVSSMIVDSAPGRADAALAVRAFSYAFPRLWLVRVVCKSVLYALLVCLRVVQAVTRTPDVITWGRMGLNDVSLLAGSRRCYIYSDADELVDWRDVESHAADAERKGWLVQREKFVGTPHVGHMRADPERYWAVVRRCLEVANSSP